MPDVLNQKQEALLNDAIKKVRESTFRYAAGYSAATNVSQPVMDRLNSLRRENARLEMQINELSTKHITPVTFRKIVNTALRKNNIQYRLPQCLSYRDMALEIADLLWKVTVDKDPVDLMD